jgi:predicted transcriptional regulator
MRDLKTNIKNVFLKNPTNEYLITDIATLLKINRHTISKYLKTLEQEEKITARKVGNYQLWTYKHQ